jgi:ribosomal protein S27E
MTITGAGIGNYTLTQPTGLKANITAKTLTVTGAVAQNKVYDGNTVAVISGATLVGVVSPDDVTLANHTTGVFAQAGIGTDIAVATLPMTITGSGIGNYTLTQPTGLKANITAKILTVTGAVAQNKVYDGNTVAAISGATLVGVVSPDDVTLANHTTGTFAQAGIGTDIAVATLPMTITGAGIGNYTLTQPTGLKANITSKILTVTGAVAQNKVYDGNTVAAISGATLVGVVSPDDVTLANHTTGVFAQAGIGTDIAVATLPMTLTGSGIRNYTLTQPTGLKANITAKPITVTAIAGQTKVYGSTDPTPFTYTFGPALIGSDVITGLMGRIAGENTGSYEFALGTLTAGPNYSLSVAATPTFIITTKPLTITADNKNKCYDGLVYGGGYTVSYLGFVNGEGPGVLGGTLVYSGTAITATNAGSYTIIPAGLTSGNYSITFQDGTLTIYPLPVPVITGLADLCAGTSGVVYTTETAMTGYNWTISAGGTITAGAGTNQITVTWNEAGSQTVAVNYINANGCTAATSTVKNVTVNPLPVPTITGSTSLCVNSGYYAYMTEASMNGYVWTLSAGGTLVTGAGTNNISVIWNTPGAQSVNVTYTNLSGCVPVAPTILNVTVTPIPGVAGSITGATTVCSGAQGVTYSTPPIADAVTYVWTLPAGASIASGTGTNNITVNFATNASSGNISVFGNNLCGNGTASSLQVAVTPLVAAAGVIAGQPAVCQGASSVVYTVAPIANATEYVWTTPPGTTIVGGAGTNLIIVDFGMNTVSGVITVYGSNSCGNGAVSPDFNVTVNPVPYTPIVIPNSDTLMSSSPNGNQWHFNGVHISGATGQFHVAGLTGWYWTEVTLNGCISDTSNHVYVIITGVEEISESQFVVYPVPNDGIFTTEITSRVEQTFDMQIFNKIGQMIYEKRKIRVQGQFKQQIDLRPIPVGIYTVVLRSEEGVMLRKVLISQ